jgi:erythronate-4-phosphate dehydrogenase
MADHFFFNSIKPDCIIINSSRGEVVNGGALKNALKNKQIRAAVIDVWENEPNIDIDLLDLVDFATPHIAGYSADGKANGTAMSVRAISDFFRFGLKNWFPQNVPIPQNAEIKIDIKNNSNQEIINQSILTTYDIQSDDKRLRNSVHTFELQRGDYPMRREFSSYSINLDKGNNSLIENLKNIGFKIE